MSNKKSKNIKDEFDDLDEELDKELDRLGHEALKDLDKETLEKMLIDLWKREIKN